MNYPSTEYLEVPGADLVAFNVYLESESDLRAYLARLQTTAAERPLLVTELGLDSRRHGGGAPGREPRGPRFGQHSAPAVPARSSSPGPTSGTGAGVDVEDWDFGLTRRDRRPKPALEAVRRAFLRTPFGVDGDWPSVTVVVCTRERVPHAGVVLRRSARARLSVPSRSSSSTTVPRTQVPPSRSSTDSRSSARRTAASRARGTRGSPRRRATSSPTSTMTRDPIRTGFATSWQRSRKASTQGPAARISRRRTTVRSQNASRARLAARFTSSCRTPLPSTSPVATWRSDATGSRPSAGSIPATASPATTSTCVGSFSAKGGRSASARRPSSGTTGERRSVATSASSVSTGARKRFWSASGQGSTTPPVT